MKKIGLICLALVLALGSLGVGYAAWTDTVTISGTVNTGEVDWEYYNIVSPGDPPFLTCLDTGIDPGWDKDVGSTTGVFSDSDGDGDYDLLTLLTLTINNAYPCYYNHCSFWVHCNGSIPIRIVGATLTYKGKDYSLPDGVWVTTDDEVLRFIWGDCTGHQLHFCDSRNMSFGFHVLQPAEQNHTYTFTISIVAVQWNEY